MAEGQLCYGCFTDITFQLFGQTPDSYNAEINRYVGAIYEGLSVDCFNCGDTVKYRKNDEGKWTQTYYRGDKE